MTETFRYLFKRAFPSVGKVVVAFIGYIVAGLIACTVIGFAVWLLFIPK